MMTLPASPKTALCEAIGPALATLPVRMDTPAARAMLVAIALQESRLKYRHQIGGPAHGLWQFERGGGVAGVLRHPASAEHARLVCELRGVEPTAAAVFERIEFDDLLAGAFARLLLWTDSAPLPIPTPANGDIAWRYYLRNWRPGQPHPETWSEFWDEACEAVA